MNRKRRTLSSNLGYRFEASSTTWSLIVLHQCGEAVRKSGKEKNCGKIAENCEKLRTSINSPLAWGPKPPHAKKHTDKTRS